MADSTPSSAPAVGLSFCPTPRRGWRLASGSTSLPVPCDRRSCEVCGAQCDREDVDVVLLDAETNSPPTVAVTLTFARPVSPAQLSRSLERLWSCARREVGPIAYAAWVEFTLGGPGVARQPHVNAVVKLDPERIGALERVLHAQWPHVAGGAFELRVSAIRDLSATVTYAGGLGGRKSGQRPPSSWRGHRFRASRGEHSYFARPIKELREQVQRRRREEDAKRRARRLIEGAPGSERIKTGVLRMLVREELNRTWRLEKLP